MSASKCCSFTPVRKVVRYLLVFVMPEVSVSVVVLPGSIVVLPLIDLFGGTANALTVAITPTASKMGAENVA